MRTQCIFDLEWECISSSPLVTKRLQKLRKTEKTADVVTGATTAELCNTEMHTQIALASSTSFTTLRMRYKHVLSPFIYMLTIQTMHTAHVIPVARLNLKRVLFFHACRVLYMCSPKTSKESLGHSHENTLTLGTPGNVRCLCEWVRSVCLLHYIYLWMSVLAVLA